MVKFENHCRGCATDGYHCIGSVCKYRRVPVYYCDKCGIDLLDVFESDGDELCEDCLMNKHRRRD